MNELIFTTLMMDAAPVGEVNPMPDLKNVSYIHATFRTTERVSAEDRKYFGVGAIDTLLPYLSQDNYNRDRRPTPMKAAILENDRLRAVFLPELGGRLWSLYDKTLQRELLYQNEIVQPCNLGLRNAWVAGGVEWNSGIKGHSPFTCAPVFVARSESQSGDPILSLYEYDRIRKTVFGINARLDGGALLIRTTVENLRDEESFAYWWSNIAVPERGVRVLTDAQDMFTCLYGDNKYTIDKVPAPIFDGEDLSYPERAKRAGDLFYVVPDEKPKWIAAVEEDGVGLLQYSTPELKGRKLFFWGQGQGGRNWNRFLTESDRPYVEIQAGLLRTQMEHCPLPAHTTLSWTECYTAIQIDPAELGGDWRTVCEKTSEYVKSLPDLAKADLPLNAPKTILSMGSGWGALEGEISNYYTFPAEAVTDEEREWIALEEKGYLEEKNPALPPVSYRIGKEIREALERSTETEAGRHWYTYLHLGIQHYAEGNPEAARDAWLTSLALTPTPWAHRNLATCYRNDFNDNDRAAEHILAAVACMTVPCRGLWVDAASLLVNCGKPEQWITLRKSLPTQWEADGRLNFYTALAYFRMGDLDGARGIVNEDFTMTDIKEGELSISALWNQLYGADRPLPARLDFRMHE